MTALPPDLKRWAQELELLPLDLALALGPWLRRLSLAIGPLQQTSAGTEGDMDGFEGITRRGHFERLLATNWLLAEELPDEFLRRVVDGELTYLQIARRHPAGANRSVALFDAGPHQLGAPRLAHIALAIILARRAAQGDTDFLWGLIQRPDDGFNDAVDVGGIHRLLDGRSAYPISAAHFHAWADALDAWGVRDEMWLVGIPARRGSAVAKAVRGHPFGGASVIEIEDDPDPAARRISVCVRPAGTPRTARVDLELPQPRTSVRLLRDPFRSMSAEASTREGIRAGVIGCAISSSGERLLLTCGDGSVASYAIPDSFIHSPGRPSIVPGSTRDTIVGVQHSRRSLSVLATDGSRLRLRVGRALPRTYTLPAGWRPPESDRGVRLCWAHGKRFLLLLDGGGTLYRLDRASPGSQPETILDGVTAIEQVRGGVICLRRSAHVLEYYASFTGEELDLLDYMSDRSFCGSPAMFVVRGTATVVAIQRDKDRWAVFDEFPARRPVVVTIPSGARVCGMTARGNAVQLVALDDDRRTIHFSGRRDIEEPFYRAQDEVAVLSVHHDGNIAYVAADGDVVIVSQSWSDVTDTWDELVRIGADPT